MNKHHFVGGNRAVRWFVACLGLSGLLFCAIACHGASPAGVEYLSDLLSERLISYSQGWGELGIDTRAKATVTVPKPVLHLGELGIDTKVVPSNEAAPKLRITDKQFARGLGTHANGEILIDLGGHFKAFETEVGVQWSDGKSAGSVVFQVLVDGKKVFDSGVMRENDPPRPVKISLSGANELQLVVGDAGDGITADLADWAEARLVRDPASRNEPVLSVDVARFARVLSWDPKVMEGTKAIRSDEFPAQDIAPYREILPSAEKTYSVLALEGGACIGLQWDENRILRRVEIEFPGAAAVMPTQSVQLQYWTGESEWQGMWQPVKAPPEKRENRLVWRLGIDEALHGTQKVRWVFSGVKEPVVLSGISAFTRSRWQTAEVCIEPAREGSAKKAEIEIYNGVLVGPSAEFSSHCTWDGAKPLQLKVCTSARRPYKADRTVLRFQTPDTAFGVAVEDLLSNDGVYVPHANVFVSRNPPPITPDAYLKSIAGQKSTLEEVRQRPDQDLGHAFDVIHARAQDRHNWVPMLISLACDNRKFLVFRDGSIVFNEYNQPDDFPGESDGVHTTAANIGQWRFVPSFGDGQALPVTRHLGGGWLPMPVTTITDKNVVYEQTTCVAPVGEAPAGKPAWFREKAMCVVEYRLKNKGADPAEVRLSFKFLPELDPQKKVEYDGDSEGAAVMSGKRILAIIDNEKPSSLSCKVEPTGVMLFGVVPAGGEKKCNVLIPAEDIGLQEIGSLFEKAPPLEQVENYWKKLLEPAMQVEIPDEFLGNLIRASQVNCMLAARNQEQSKYVVPWISSVHFAYPESEANSIIRGMDMTGHAEFARRGLEFYLKECNAAGFITILVHNKAAGISSGYTIVGTGEVLWTLGEHYERTRDQAWLRKVAPDVARICQWLLRQREKTKRLDARGQKVPEYGLMPPGVSADWNRFAYRFFNEAQYWRGLEMAGKALADVGDPAAPMILEAAKQYREDIVRAYHAMQGKMPVVPLGNGTWAPADPSLLGCYGNVEDFLPGEDVNRTYVYSVELGAHHLVVNGVLDAASADADWMIDYLEDVQFLARKNWHQDMSKVDAFDWGGFAKMQPYYCRIAEIYAQRDDVKPFLRSYFNMIPALMNLEDMTFWESMDVAYATGAWNKTHETGWFLGQTHTMFATERGDEIWLAPFVTNQWLKDGRTVAVRNAPTRFGKVDYTISSHAARGEIEAVVKLPAKCAAKNVVLRLRHPDGRPMQSASVQGKPAANFDPRKETISFPPSDESITVRATY